LKPRRARGFFVLVKRSAFGCGFKWSVQHLISKYREEDVVYEAKTQKIFH